MSRSYLPGVRKVFFIVMNCPLIDHDDGVLWDEITFIPIVFGNEMIRPEFIDWSPAECFLRQRGLRLEIP